MPFCDDTTGSSSIAIWQRNVHLILFLIACLVASVVFWMRRKCFSRSGCAPYLWTNRYFTFFQLQSKCAPYTTALRPTVCPHSQDAHSAWYGVERGDPHLRDHRSIARAPEQCVDVRHRSRPLRRHPMWGLPGNSGRRILSAMYREVHDTGCAGLGLRSSRHS